MKRRRSSLRQKSESSEQLVGHRIISRLFPYLLLFAFVRAPQSVELVLMTKTRDVMRPHDLAGAASQGRSGPCRQTTQGPAERDEAPPAVSRGVVPHEPAIAVSISDSLGFRETRRGTRAAGVTISPFHIPPAALRGAPSAGALRLASFGVQASSFSQSLQPRLAAGRDPHVTQGPRSGGGVLNRSARGARRTNPELRAQSTCAARQPADSA